MITMFYHWITNAHHILLSSNPRTLQKGSLTFQPWLAWQADFQLLGGTDMTAGLLPVGSVWQDALKLEYINKCKIVVGIYTPPSCTELRVNAGFYGGLLVWKDGGHLARKKTTTKRPKGWRRNHSASGIGFEDSLNLNRVERPPPSARSPDELGSGHEGTGTKFPYFLHCFESQVKGRTPQSPASDGRTRLCKTGFDTWLAYSNRNRPPGLWSTALLGWPWDVGKAEGPFSYWRGSEAGKGGFPILGGVWAFCAS